MNIAGRELSPSQPPYLIAEIGVNHDGSVERGIELARAANHVGADAIKLQLFDADLLLSKAARLAEYQRNVGAVDAFDMLRELQLDAKQLGSIADAANDQQLHVIITVFSIALVDDAEAHCTAVAYKTASPDIINRPLIDALIATGKPLILSAGAATLDEVQRASVWLGDHPYVFMQCVSSYPTPDECASLGGLRALQRITPYAHGYSDHTTAIDTGALAVAAGACVLEKHLTYDRTASGPDHAASLDPTGFAEYVRLAHRAWNMTGPQEKRVLDIEQGVRSVSRQSITTTRDLPAGHILTRADLTIKRPGTGIAPFEMNAIIGRTLIRDVAADTPLVADAVENAPAKSGIA